MNRPDFLIVGTGLSALSFGALMAKSGKRVRFIEAHEYPGGYGHTFPEGDHYRFNAQLHYVWNCGEGQPVNQILCKLGLDEEVTFESYDPDGYDRMRIPGYALDIPYDFDLLGDRLTALFPKSEGNFRRFLSTVRLIGQGIREFNGVGNPLRLAKNARAYSCLARYHRMTLQQMFDAFALPLEAQSLLASQWPDFLLPPAELSVISWAALFTGYSRGAYYPTHHFEHVVKSLERVIREHGGELLYETRVVDFIVEGNAVTGVIAENLSGAGERSEHFGKNVVCNIDPQRAAQMIGFDKFSGRTRKLLRYDYSHSNFMGYCVVEGIDLEKLGFARSNLFHSCDVDLNKAYHKMYTLGDYSAPSFAITTPSLHTRQPGSCREGQHIIEFLTAANYQRFLELRISSRKKYNEAKLYILDRMIDLAEEHYIPNLREHLVLKISGSPTTSERYCGAPRGNSYGSNMTPRNMGLFRLDYRTSLDNFYFCNASAGYPGFAGTFATGARLSEALTGDNVFRGGPA